MANEDARCVHVVAGTSRAASGRRGEETNVTIPCAITHWQAFHPAPPTQVLSQLAAWQTMFTLYTKCVDAADKDTALLLSYYSV